MKRKLTTFAIFLAISVLLTVGAFAVPALGPNNAPDCSFGTFSDTTLDLYKGEFKDDNLCLDFDGDNISVQSSEFDSNVIALSTSQPANDTLAFNFTAVGIGTTQANVTVTDGISTKTFSIDFTVISTNNAPDCSFGTNTSTLDLYKGEFKDDNLCLDFDGDELTVTGIAYNTSVLNIATAQPSDDTYTFNFTGKAVGRTVANITVTDGFDSTTFSVDLTIISSNNAPDCSFGTFDDTTLYVGESPAEKSDNLCLDFDGDNVSLLSSEFNSSVVSVSSNNPSLDTIAFNVTPTGAGNTTVTLVVTDGFDTDSIVLNFTVKDNRPMANGSINDTETFVGEAVVIENISQYFTDANNDTLFYSIFAKVRSFGSINVTFDNVSNNLTITPNEVGAFYIYIEATDGANYASQGFVISVPNRVPEFNLSDDSVQVNAIYTLNLSTVTFDADGHNISYNITNTSNNATADCSIANETLTCDPITTGSVVITINATDGYDVTTDNFTLSVTAVPTSGGGSPRNVGGGGSGNIGTFTIVQNPTDPETEEDTEEQTDETEESSGNNQVTVDTTPNNDNPETEETNSQPETGNIITGQATGPNDSNFQNLFGIGGIILLIVIIAGIAIFVMKNRK